MTPTTPGSSFPAPPSLGGSNSGANQPNVTTTGAQSGLGEALGLSNSTLYLTLAAVVGVALLARKR